MESGGAGIGEGIDDGAEQIFAGGGEREVGEGGVFLLDAGALAGEIGIECHGLGRGIAGRVWPAGCNTAYRKDRERIAWRAR